MQRQEAVPCLPDAPWPLRRTSSEPAGAGYEAAELPSLPTRLPTLLSTRGENCSAKSTPSSTNSESSNAKHNAFRCPEEDRSPSESTLAPTHTRHSTFGDAESDYEGALLNSTGKDIGRLTRESLGENLPIAPIGACKVDEDAPRPSLFCSTPSASDTPSPQESPSSANCKRVHFSCTKEDLSPVASTAAPTHTRHSTLFSSEIWDAADDCIYSDSSSVQISASSSRIVEKFCENASEQSTLRERLCTVNVKNTFIDLSIPPEPLDLQRSASAPAESGAYLPGEIDDEKSAPCPGGQNEKRGKKSCSDAASSAAKSIARQPRQSQQDLRKLLKQASKTQEDSKEVQAALETWMLKGDWLIAVDVLKQWLQLEGSFQRCCEHQWLNYVLSKCLMYEGAAEPDRPYHRQFTEFVALKMLEPSLCAKRREDCPDNPAYCVIAAEHKYGCRVVQRLMDNYSRDGHTETVTKVFEKLVFFEKQEERRVPKIISMSGNRWSNYVMGKALDKAPAIYRNTIIDAFRNNPVMYAQQKNLSWVLERALPHCEVDSDIVTKLLNNIEELTCCADGEFLSAGFIAMKVLVLVDEHDAECPFAKQMFVPKEDANQTRDNRGLSAQCAKRCTCVHPHTQKFDDAMRRLKQLKDSIQSKKGSQRGQTTHSREKSVKYLNRVIALFDAACQARKR